MKDAKQHLYEMETIWDVPIKMRDGTTLYGDLYRCKSEKPCPTILSRYIFKKGEYPKHWTIYDPSFFVKKGYNVYFQDVRGAGESEGEFIRFTADCDDGYDSVEWLAQQPWCDGNVGMFGDYYGAFLQYTAAYVSPPHLKAICPFQTNVTLNRNNNTRGFLFASHIGWCLSRIIDRMNDGWYDEETKKKMLPVLQKFFDKYPEQVKYRPLSEMPAAHIKEFGIFADYLEHLVMGYDNLDLVHIEGKDMDLSKIAVPVLGCASWFDDCRNSTLEQFMELQKNGTGLAKQSEVVIGPWEGGNNFTVSGVELDFGKSADNSQQLMQQVLLEWFDRWLKGIQPEKVHMPVKVFTVGPNKWEEAPTWPLPANDLTLYLHSGGNANEVPGDGQLSYAEAFGNEEADHYLYNPNQLINTQALGKDQSKLEERPDILVYTSDAIKEDVLISGLTKAEFSISSSAPDTDFMVKLLDVTDENKAIAISEGATRVKYRNSWTPELVEPGTVFDLEVKIGYVNYLFKKGHKFRIEIASSNFMKFDYNHNTGKRVEHDAEIKCAINTVHHSKDAQSKIILPVRKSSEAK